MKHPKIIMAILLIGSVSFIVASKNSNGFLEYFLKYTGCIGLIYLGAFLQKFWHIADRKSTNKDSK